MQFLGFIGVFAEAKKLVTSQRRIFSQITLSLILPLSLLVLIHTQISNRLLKTLVSDEDGLENSPAGTAVHDRLSRAVVSEWARFLLFKAVYFTLLLALSLLSTAAVVYAVASVYAAKNDLSFSKIMTVVPKVWKRLIVTFSFTFLAFFAYHVLAFAILFAILMLFLDEDYSFSAVVILCVFMAVYGTGIVYLSLVWQLASVVSVLEDCRGIGAMRKSKALTKGKMWTSFLVFGALVVLGFLLQLAFQSLVVDNGNAFVTRAFYGALCLLASVSLFLLGLVVQTVLYFVCKSYHHENIDKSALSDHLEVYLLGDYVPLVAKDVQLEQYHV